MEKDLSEEGAQAVFEDGSVDFDKMWGFGYLAGAAFGVSVNQLSFQLSCQYRSIRHDLNLKADYAGVSQVSGSYDPEDVTLLMQGISVGLGGSFAF